MERDHRRKEASDAVRRQIAEALKEKDELVKVRELSITIARGLAWHVMITRVRFVKF